MRAHSTKPRSLWYQPRKGKWPKKIVDKPYSTNFGRLQFMPRYGMPQKALELWYRRMMRKN